MEKEHTELLHFYLYMNVRTFALRLQQDHLPCLLYPTLTVGLTALVVIHPSVHPVFLI